MSFKKTKSDCERRKGFKTEAACRATANAMNRGGQERYPVLCPHCSKWHLARRHEQW